MRQALILAVILIVPSVRADESYDGEGLYRVPPSVLTIDHRPEMAEPIQVCLFNIWRKEKALLGGIVPTAEDRVCPELSEIKFKYSVRMETNGDFVRTYTEEARYSAEHASRFIGESRSINYLGEEWSLESLPQRAVATGVSAIGEEKKIEFCMGVLATKEKDKATGKYKREFLACPAPAEKDACHDVKKCFDTRYELKKPLRIGLAAKTSRREIPDVDRAIVSVPGKNRYEHAN